MAGSDEMDRSFEAQLRAAKLLQPGVGLDARIEMLFRQPQRAGRWRRPAALVAVAAGVVLVSAVTARWSLRPAPSMPAVLSMPQPAITSMGGPQRFECEVCTTDEGPVTVVNQTPFVRVHQTGFRNTWLIDVGAGTRLLVRVPVERVTIKELELF